MAYLDYNGLQRFKANLDAQTNGLIAPVYDSTKTYDVGDYVIYNNDLYRCTTAITTAEAWTAAHWTQVALGDDVADLKSALTKYDTQIYPKRTDLFTISAYINTSGESVLHHLYRRTDYLPIDTYYGAYVNGNAATLAVSFYDSSKTFISGISKVGNSLAFVNPAPPANAEYYIIGTLYNGIENAFVVLDRFGIIESTIKNYNAKINPLNGKTIVFLGDSLTAQNIFTKALADKYGVTQIRYGVGGSTIADWGQENSFVSRAATINDTCDAIYVLGGTNDWGQGVMLGDKTSTDVSTFYGGLKSVLNTLRTNYPATPVFISTILQRNFTSQSQPTTGISANSNNVPLYDFNEAIRYVAQIYGAIVVDGFGESGITVSNIATYTSDNLHLNNAGGEKYADYIYNKVSQYLR